MLTTKLVNQTIVSWDCGKKLFGEGTKADEKWVHQRLGLLSEKFTYKREVHPLLRGVKEKTCFFGKSMHNKEPIKIDMVE